MIFYTDGACSGNPGFGGWAVLNTSTGEIISGSHYPATNNQMELYAIFEAVLQMPEGSKCEVHTDSRISINWIVKRYRCDLPHLGPIRQAIDDLMLYNKLEIKFIKVKGHSIYVGNNIVDKVASDAAKALKLRTK